ncbi:AzlC family ABC transporter permease [Atopobium fossor]|uniref:AzlC family ABC transporter permease n=1 Tax=Atopobium fossor TaxID=39487 RepID=UPI0004073A42|nr:AzlC family ABC transporter permease [Atopobium fossor]
MSISSKDMREALVCAAPVMIGYVSIGIPCGILESAAGLGPWVILVASLLFYSGAGQFMAANMLMAGSPIASIIMSISFVNTRQMLYSAALAPHTKHAGKLTTLLFASTVTDESFGINLEHFTDNPSWNPQKATLVNVFCHCSWIASNMMGCLVGNVISIPMNIASFAMTAIFVCLLFTQRIDKRAVVVVAVSMAGVFACKCLGLTGPAILLGALLGVCSGVLYDRMLGE